jgi:hypothetical protein
VTPNGWHIFVTIARSKAAEPFRARVCAQGTTGRPRCDSNHN